MISRKWPKPERSQFTESIRAYLLACGAQQERRWCSTFGDGLPAYRFAVASVAGQLSVAVYPGVDRRDGLGWIAARFQDQQAGQQVGADRFGSWNWWPDAAGSLPVNIAAVFQRFAGAGVVPVPSPVETGNFCVI